MAENDSDIKVQFDKATTYVRSIVSKLNNQQMLQFYGLFKQATEGACAKPKPSWYEITEKQKWEAWSGLKELSSEEAMRRYVDLINSIDSEWEEKPIENASGWVHHSCMKNNEEDIADSNKTIFDWVKEKNVEKVKLASGNLAQGVNELDENGLSLLHWAADRGSLDIVKHLVENLEADVNVRDSNGQTPLHFAVSCDYDDVAKYLVKSGADINIKDNDGLTPYNNLLAE